MGHCSSRWETKHLLGGSTTELESESPGFSSALSWVKQSWLKKEQQISTPDLGPLAKSSAGKWETTHVLFWPHWLLNFFLPLKNEDYLSHNQTVKFCIGWAAYQVCKQLYHRSKNRLFYSVSIWLFGNLEILTFNLLGITRKCLETLQSSGTLDSKSQRNPSRE